jgi:predicted CoA-binding protein
MDKKTVVLGASPHLDRYSNIAVHRLQRHGYEVVPLGFQEGTIDGTPIVVSFPTLEDIHTVTLYLNPFRQKEYYDYILSLQPKRIIFNPGTENPALQQLAEAKGIETKNACTLVMLSLGSY